MTRCLQIDEGAAVVRNARDFPVASERDNQPGTPQSAMPADHFVVRSAWIRSIPCGVVVRSYSVRADLPVVSCPSNNSIRRLHSGGGQRTRAAMVSRSRSLVTK